MDPSSIRKNWRLHWLWSLVPLTDIESQQHWIDKRIKNPAWSYVEFRSVYFDDSSLSESCGGYEKMIQDGFISREEHNCIKDFHNALDNYKEPNGDYDTAAILNDPKWQKIVALGKESLIKLAQVITEPAEKEALFEKPSPLTEKDFTWPN